MPAEHPRPPAPATPPTNPAGCFLRVVWMLLGNAALLITALKIAENHNSRFSIADAIFWGVVIATATVRYLDIRRFGGHTATGKPASPADFRRYVLLLIGFALLLWLVAHGYEYFTRPAHV